MVKRERTVVVESPGEGPRKVMKFQAKCSCGWLGKLRLESLAAGKDIEEHLDDINHQHQYVIQPKERSTLRARSGH